MVAMNERRARILQLVAESYIDTAHPVASARIAERLGLSSATVRNEFGALEEGGYLQQPHTSAGRIPTPRGFRAYALGCLPPRRLPRRQRALLESQFRHAHGESLFGLMARSAAELSGYAVVVSLPSDEALEILEIHLSLISNRRLMAVVVLENGLVRQLGIDLDPTPSDDVLDDAERNLRQLTLPLGEVPEAVHGLSLHADADLARTLRAIAAAWPQLHPPRRFSDGLREVLSEPESQDPSFIRLVIEHVEHGSSEPPADLPLHLDLDDAVARVTTIFELGGAHGYLTLIGPARMRYRNSMMVAHGVRDALLSEPPPATATPGVAPCA